MWLADNGNEFCMLVIYIGEGRFGFVSTSGTTPGGWYMVFLITTGCA